MRQLLQHVSRSFSYELSSSARVASGHGLRLQKPSIPYICVQCRQRVTLSTPSRRQNAFRDQFSLLQSRQFSNSPRLDQEEKLNKAPNPISPDVPTARPNEPIEALKDDQPPKIPLNGSTVHMVPDEDLPSHQEKLRWKLSKRFNQIMDDLMPRISLASQRINKFTGTDYTGIEALRKEISEQEKLVKARLDAVQDAKDALEVARGKESTSRKEVVGLLERKHAWSDADLERYMNLIRSEHLNDQGIQAAKDNMTLAELSLEEARTRLEKRERMQYHEEQIWSDTIRRNSTWVTIGLMGVNIFLLLATLILIEPWRRRRLVKEIRKTLEENQPTAVTVPVIAQAIDAVVEPKGVSLEVLEAALSNQPAATSPIEVAPVEGEKQVENKPQLLDLPETVAAILSDPIDTNATQPPLESWSLEYCRNYIKDLFSDQRILLRKVEVTTIALEGAAVGAAIVSLLIILLKPK